MIRFLQRLRLYCKGTGLTREKYEAMALRSHSARNRRSPDYFTEEWMEFLAKLHFDYLEKLKADGKISRA